MKNKPYLLIFGSLIIILLAIAMVAILGNIKPNSSSSDIRARAGTQKALQLVGIVSSVNGGTGTLQITNVHFSDANRSGSPLSLGDWTVTVPPGFNLASVSPGMTVTVGVDAATFNITSHAVSALTLTAGQ